ncbi:dihydropteroate synthase [Gracilimonas sediminicola]|uniref:Dihydropteroate synthase n=1 Tax=Gracilimonas sediminicola TaxID=2952158 RepID=A0A9X2REH2_9BACT|nr:dihydropteroate synthase [Gracilimonas sediminicola]MCP9291027.1 dihydropteroate synthase [Gracilimonas sediminicola]
MPDDTFILSASSSPKIMGIINATPDSFSDGGKYLNHSRAMDRIHLMLKNGAQIIDVGGESTRPGAEPVSESEEIDRVIPLLEKAIPVFSDAIFSIDTTKYEVAKKALQAGAKIVNDVSGLQKDPRLADLCAEHNAAYVLMHSQGDPKTMQKNPAYNDVVEDVMAFFEQQAAEAKKRGVHHLILDPGIGFGKTLEHNLKLIAHLDKFKKFGFPVLVGASRKSMIGKILDDRPTDDRITGTVALHYHALIKGANILRVHDVKEASDSIRIFNAVQSQQ